MLYPGCTEATGLNRLAAGWNILHYTSTGTPDIYTRVNGLAPTWITSSFLSYDGLENFIVKIFRTYQWKSVLLLLDRTEFSNPWFAGAVDAVASTLQKRIPDSQIYTRTFIDAKKVDNSTDMDFLEEAKYLCRIVVFFGMTISFRRILAEATMLSMANGEYVYLAVEPFPHPSWGNFSWKFNDELDKVLEETWRSVLVISLAQSETSRLQILAPRFPVWKAHAKESYYFDIPDSEEINISQLSAYEAMSILLKILWEAVVVTPLNDWSNGTELAERFRNRTINLSTGPVRISDNGARSVNLLLRDYSVATGGFESVLLYDALRNEIDVAGAIDWPHRVSPPPNAPVCGFSGGLCVDKSSLVHIVVGAVLAVTLVLLLALGFVFRKYMQSKGNLDSKRWLISRALLSHPVTENLTVSDISIRSLRSKGMSMPTGRLPPRETKSSQSIPPTGKNRTVPSNMIYGHQSVWVKQIPCAYSLDRLPTSVTKLLAQLSTLYHQNIDTFIGICPADHGAFVSVFEPYCKRGSLHEFLSLNHPDPELKKSFIQDLIFGLRFIHESPVKKHGYLTSSCCLLDGRFILKIAKLSHHKLAVLIGNFSHKALLPALADVYWTAPEFIIDPELERTQKGDVFSLAIIISHICLGSLSYSESPEELYQQITVCKNLHCRPVVDHPNINEDLVDVLKTCWHEKPGLRYTVQQAQAVIFHKMIISKGDKLIDKMMRRLRNYAEELETRVCERTLELQREQNQSDSLLAEVFPKSIVHRLRSKEQIEPELFEKATVCFSDIVGFAEYVKTATPYEVISFLYKIYATFDRVIPSFDVYKVETINDSYVVASGLPIKNGDNHGKEIAGMACQLMKVYYKSQFRGETDLRVGIHTGPIAAGIVGTKSPRYCLFGDTMNTASRMESHGEAGGIHLSSEATSLITAMPQFVINSRGLTLIKGKGEMQTFWLEWHISMLEQDL